MNILDENIIASQRQPLRGWRIPADLPFHFGQATPYNPLVSLLLEGRKSQGVSAYILRQRLRWGKGVPNAARMAF
jgi:hypothetical protein